MTFLSRVLPVAACALAIAAPSALAAPVTIQLRVEGADRTLFYGPVTTDTHAFQFTDDTTPHACDGTAANNGGDPSAAAGPTRGAALTVAAQQNGFSLKGTWDTTYKSPTITEVAGENVSYDAGTGRFLAEYLNDQPSQTGSCVEQIHNGDEVLFAYAAYPAPALKLSGPATAKPGQAFGVHVTDGSGAAVAGASVGGQTSDGAGDAAVTLSDRGPQTLKADKSSAVRSAPLTVCVSDGADGYCGTSTPSGSQSSTPIVPDRQAPRASISSLEQGETVSRKKAPRVLRGKVAENGGILMVKLRLLRTYRGRCQAYSATRERWIRRPVCRPDQAWWFRVGSTPNWQYQLPRALPPGRYTLDVNAIDKAYNRDDARRPGENRVVFTVR